MGKLDPVRFGGATVDRRTAAMLTEAQRLANEKDADIGTFHLCQGCWSHAAASAGTHSGPGAFDMYTAGYTAQQKEIIGLALREVGFASWKRTRIPGKWEEHWHGIAMDTEGLPSIAADQVRSYRAGRDGLVGNRPDPDPRPSQIRTWEQYLAAKPAEAPATEAAPAEPDAYAIGPGRGFDDPTDTDGDGLADVFERLVGTDPTRADSDGDLIPDAREPGLTATDTDHDRLSDAVELQRSSNPAMLDTDGDGMTDWLEATYGGPGRLGAGPGPSARPGLGPTAGVPAGVRADPFPGPTDDPVS